jgi:hypothetical protein
MTNREILFKILGEASGQSINDVADMATHLYPLMGSGFRLDEKIPATKAQELLAKYRQELPGIRAWLIRSAFMANPGGKQGTA